MVQDTIRIGHLSTMYHTAFLLRGSGLLADQGISTTWTLFPSGPDIISAMQAGTLDLGYLGGPVLSGPCRREAPQMALHRFPVRRGVRGPSLAAAAAALALVAAAAIAVSSSASAGTPSATGCSSRATSGPTHIGRIGGLELSLH